MAVDEGEFAALREEVARLRGETDRMMSLLGMASEYPPNYKPPAFPSPTFGSLYLRHSEGSNRVAIHGFPNSSGMILNDAEGHMRARLMVWRDGTAQLQILNAQGKIVASIGEGADGGGEIRVNDAGGAPRVGLKAGPSGGVVTVVDGRGHPLATMAGDEDGGRMFVFTTGQQPAATMQAGPQGGLVTVSETGGQLMGSLAVTATGAALSVHGELGAPAVTVSGLGELGGRLIFYSRDGDETAALP